MSQDDTKLSSRQHQVVPNGNVEQHVVLPSDNPRVALKGFCKMTPNVALDNCMMPQETILSSLWHKPCLAWAMFLEPHSPAL